MQDYKVLTIIVTYNGMKWIDRCLNSVMESQCHTDCLLIDNLSNDGTLQFVKEKYPDVILYESPINLGFGQGNNIGIQYAIDNGYDYIYLLNQDAYLFPDTIDNLIHIQIQNSDFGILSPLQFQNDEYSLDKNFLTSLSRAEENILFDFLSCAVKDIYEVPDVMAAHWLVSRSCFATVGGFSPTFLQYGEDNNYQDRAAYFKFKIGIVPSAKAIHDRSERVVTKGKKLNDFKIFWLVAMSDVSNDNHFSFASAIKSAISNSIHFKSFAPICTIVSLQLKRRMIIENRRASMLPGAFVNNNDLQKIVSNVKRSSPS